MQEVMYTRLEGGAHQFTTPGGTRFINYGARDRELGEDERRRISAGLLWKEWHWEQPEEAERWLEGDLAVEDGGGGSPAS